MGLPINKITNLSNNELVLTNICVISYLPTGRQVGMIHRPIVLASLCFGYLLNSFGKRIEERESKSSRTMPVPLATAVSGSSAIWT